LLIPLKGKDQQIQRRGKIRRQRDFRPIERVSRNWR
jgi:hypothetical protein